MIDDESQVVYLPFFQTVEGDTSADAEPGTSDQQIALVVDYTEQLQALADNQLAQLDAISAALAVIVFALAAIFGAITARGLFHW